MFLSFVRTAPITVNCSDFPQRVPAPAPTSSFWLFHSFLYCSDGSFSMACNLFSPSAFLTPFFRHQQVFLAFLLSRIPLRSSKLYQIFSIRSGVFSKGSKTPLWSSFFSRTSSPCFYLLPITFVLPAVGSCPSSAQGEP